MQVSLDSVFRTVFRNFLRNSFILLTSFIIAFILGVCSDTILLYIASYSIKLKLSANYEKRRSVLLARFKYHVPSEGKTHFVELAKG